MSTTATDRQAVLSLPRLLGTPEQARKIVGTTSARDLVIDASTTAGASRPATRALMKALSQIDALERVVVVNASTRLRQFMDEPRRGFLLVHQDVAPERLLRS